MEFDIPGIGYDLKIMSHRDSYLNRTFKEEYTICEYIQCTGYNVGISHMLIPTVHVYKTCTLGTIKLFYSTLSIGFIHF